VSVERANRGDLIGLRPYGRGLRERVGSDVPASQLGRIVRLSPNSPSNSPAWNSLRSDRQFVGRRGRLSSPASRPSLALLLRAECELAHSDRLAAGRQANRRMGFVKDGT
jgi:hypothetical protein